MTERLLCNVPGKDVRYPIEVSSGLFESRTLLDRLQSIGSRFAIVTDFEVQKLYGDALQKRLVAAGYKAELFSFPSGEKQKTRRTKERIEDAMLFGGWRKDTCIIALGGGVVTDLAGYVAATFCRGIPWILVPTSLVGMVDAGVGGKTGVDTPAGKNLIGAFYQPEAVLIDPSLLKTLPLSEFKQGIPEIIKHGLVADRTYFEFLEKNAEGILRSEPAVLYETIARSCRIKKEIVEADVRDEGRRVLLNFGHTVGHALETLSDYSISHGDAVATGIIVECRISQQIGGLSDSDFRRIETLFKTFGISTGLSRRFSPEELLRCMAGDKKGTGGRPRYIRLKEIGIPLSEDGSFCSFTENFIIENALSG